MGDYEVDVLQWSERQAELLRRRAAGDLINDTDLDWLNLAEEIDSVGRAERSDLASRTRTIIEHLAKLEASPSHRARIKWTETVLRSRLEIERLFEDSPSLRGRLDEIVKRERPRALQLVAASFTLHNEKARRSVRDIHYTPDQIVGSWLP